MLAGYGSDLQRTLLRLVLDAAIFVGSRYIRRNAHARMHEHGVCLLGLCKRRARAVTQAQVRTLVRHDSRLRHSYENATNPCSLSYQLCGCFRLWWTQNETDLSSSSSATRSAFGGTFSAASPAAPNAYLGKHTKYFSFLGCSVSDCHGWSLRRALFTPRVKHGPSGRGSRVVPGTSAQRLRTDDRTRCTHTR